MNTHRFGQTGESGFTLVELLMAIVLVAILSAVAITGIAGLQEKGQTAACATSLESAKSATEMYYSVTGGKYPQTFADLTNPPAGSSPLLQPAPGVIQSTTTLEGKGGGWTVTLVPGTTATDRTTFTGCAPAVT
jgi:prepilin-type N-terminal cleavage/methylation domain-containing protein